MRAVVVVAVSKVMAKEESAGPAAVAAAAVEKHFALGIYGLPPTTGAMPPSPQTQRPIKHSSSRVESTQDEQDFLSSQHCKLLCFICSNKHCVHFVYII